MAQPYILIPATGADQADEWIRLGIDSHTQNKLPDADRFYRQALRLNPRHAIATQNLAILFAQLNNLNEGLLAIERAAMFSPTNALIHVNRAFMCLDAERIDDAIVAAQIAVDLCPDCGDGTTMPVHNFVSSRLVAALIAATAGNPPAAVECYTQLLKQDPKHPTAGPNRCFVTTLTTASAETATGFRREWYEANRYIGPKRSHYNDRDPNRPLRVGYVGGDFKRHSAAMIFGAVALHHNHQQCLPYFYSTLPVNPLEDGATKRFMEAAGWDGKLEPVGQHNGNTIVAPKPPRWRDASAVDDETLDNMIRQDKIDILVDLAAHTNGGRLAVFTRKPAPVQVSAWGFAHGTGVPEIDYFFGDPIAVPSEERDSYAEKIFDLPCIVAYEPVSEYGLKTSSILPYYQHDYITFGSYARYEKLSDECLLTFAEILRRVPNSRLEFKDHAFRRPYSIRRIMSAMPDISPERLLFSISTSHPDHMLAHQQCDLALDPFPHGGGIVSLEQLYMGVPVVTLYGTQPAGRTASSVLTALNRSDWIARTTQEYIEIAVRLAEDVPLLAKARKTLSAELLASQVVTGYREAVEQAYRQIWQTWCHS